MKKLFVTLLVIGFGITVFGQANNYLEVTRSVFNVEKKALIAEIMTLSDAEAELFWPLYNEYEEKLYVINTRYFNTVQEFSDNFENMTDETAIDIMNKAIKIDQDILKLEKQYLKKFSKIITPQKTLRFYQAQNKLSVMVDYQLLDMVPLLETE